MAAAGASRRCTKSRKRPAPANAQCHCRFLVRFYDVSHSGSESSATDRRVAGHSKWRAFTIEQASSSMAPKRYSLHRRQRLDCYCKQGAVHRSLSRRCRQSKDLAGLTLQRSGHGSATTR